ncbi:MAG: helix-turn-helix domain-containing protein [Caldilineaceae bacterium]|nr:helix-turn-helix domain-containing protein [Caldilineaceae bacterium]
MFTIHKAPDADTLLVSREHDPANTLQLANLAELVALRLRLTEYLDTLQADPEPDSVSLAVERELIDTATARRLAAEQGVEVNDSTLRVACRRGHVEAARRRGGRWVMPRWAFEAWLAQHLRHTEK